MKLVWMIHLDGCVPSLHPPILNMLKPDAVKHLHSQIHSPLVAVHHQMQQELLIQCFLMIALWIQTCSVMITTIQTTTGNASFNCDFILHVSWQNLLGFGYHCVYSLPCSFKNQVMDVQTEICTNGEIHQVPKSKDLQNKPDRPNKPRYNIITPQKMIISLLRSYFTPKSSKKLHFAYY